MGKKESNGVNNILIILLIVISICLVVSVSYITYDKIFKDDTIEKEDDLKDNNDDVEKETDSIELNNTMKRYVEILERINVVGDYSSGFGSGVIYANNFKNSDILGDDKLHAVLKQLYVENRDKSPVTTDYDFGNDYMKSVNTQIEVSEVERIYKDLFGSSVGEHKDFGICPYFIYDSVNSKYYGSMQCGNASTLFFETYVYSVTTKGNDVYVYVSFASSDMGNAGPVIYTDYERTDVYKDNVQPQELVDIVNENNYNDFSQYKYVFTKNGDSYSFTNIEKIK